MAIFDYTKGGFSGAVGKQYGCFTKGKALIKKIPISPQKKSATQITQVRAFEHLNRFSSAFAKIGYNYCFLPPKNKLKHNVVSNYFKFLVQNHVFDFSHFEEICIQDESIKIEQFEVNLELGYINLQVSDSAPISKENKSVYFVFVFNSLEQCIFGEVPATNICTKQLAIMPKIENTYKIVVFRTVKRNGSLKFYSFEMKEM